MNLHVLYRGHRPYIVYRMRQRHLRLDARDVELDRLLIRGILIGAHCVGFFAGLESQIAHSLLISLEEAEKELIRNTLKMVGGNREQAAHILGIGERTLYRKIKEYGIDE